MINEFKDLNLLCTGSSIVPSGPGYGTTVGPNQICTLAGAKAGEQYVSGADYIDASFQFEASQLWRNFGILIAFFIAFLVMCVVAVERQQGVIVPSIVIFDREDVERKQLNERLIERKEAARNGELELEVKNMVTTRKPFTWEKLSYTVPVGGGHKRLLNSVYGYVLVSHHVSQLFIVMS